MGKGSLMVITSLLIFGFCWDLFRFFQFSFLAFFLGLAGAGVPWILFEANRLPGFFWGKDPAFWLSIHAGAVAEPPWSPLSYLLAQAACFLLPQRQFTLLPELSGFVLALALFFFVMGFTHGIKNKTLSNLFLVPAVSWFSALTLPFWNTATTAMGLIGSLGLLLFLFQKYLLDLEEKPGRALGLNLGLLWAIHPLWGFLGSIKLLGSLDFRRWSWRDYLFPFFLGLTPFAWVIFRTEKSFPSWGGPRPFWEMVINWKSLFLFYSDRKWSLLSALEAWGWGTVFLFGVVFLLASLYFFKWKTGNKSLYPTLDLWLWVLAFMGGILFFSFSSEALGTTALLIPLGLGEMFLKLLEKGMERRQTGYFSGSRLLITAGLFLFVGSWLSLLPGQHFYRSGIFFPQQHALNLLQILSSSNKVNTDEPSPATPGFPAETPNPKKVLVCDDEFEAYACREARLIEPVSLSAVILEKRYLAQRWYLNQLIQREPELLFSSLLGSEEDLFKNLLLNNRNYWEIHRSLSTPLPEWKEDSGYPAVLTRVFGGSGPTGASLENIQYRLDLSALPRPEEKTNGPTKEYFYRYISGFNELGKNLMEKGLYLASIHALDRALKLDPGYTEPQALLSKMYSQQNILEAAQLEFEKTIRTKPARLNQLIGELEEAQKEKNEVKSVTLLDEMIRLNTELADAQYQLSIIFNREGRAQEAKALLESSVRLNPKQIEAQLTMGRLMARMGSRIKAEEAYRAVLGINPENKEAQVELWKLLNK